MVKYETILKIIKTHYSLKEIGKQISPTIKQISDNQKEYDDLMNIIPRFYRDYWNSPVEYVQLTCVDGYIWENSGDKFGVSVATGLAYENPIMYSIHTHTKGCTSYQSIGDYMIMLDKTREKYLITIGADGVLISKDTFDDWSKTRTNNCIKAWNENQDHIEYEELLKDPDVKLQFDKINDLTKRNIYGEQIGTAEEIDEAMNDYREVANKKLQNYLINNIDKEVDNLNRLYGNYDVGITVTHIPIKKL